MSPQRPAALKHFRTLLLSRFYFSRLTICCLVLVGALSVSEHLPGFIEFAQKQVEKSTPAKTQGQPATKKAGAAEQDTTRELRWSADKAGGTEAVAAPVYPAFKADTQAYALIIGISSYPTLRQSAQLKYADEDARQLHQFLIGEKGGFKPENVIVLLNQDATHDQIQAALGRLQNLSGPDSLALIFFAGHGMVNESGQAFLVASDTRLDDLLNTGVDMRVFNSTVQSFRARSSVIITDACHAGALSDLISSPGNGKVANLSPTSFADPPEKSSFIFTAASPTQVSVERPSLQHGLFTYYMLQGLEGPADSDADGLVTSRELYGYVAAKIRNDKEVVGTKQVPEFNTLYDRSIPLAAVSEEGRARYLKWFNENSVVSRLVAAFDDSLRENRLTRPHGLSAWDFYSALIKNEATAAEVTNIAKQKREEFLDTVKTEADKLIEQSPRDSNAWDEARENLDKAYQLSHDESFNARRLYSNVMYRQSIGEIAAAEREADTALAQLVDSGASNPLLSVKIGKFYAELKKWDKALRAYKPAMNGKASVSWVTEYSQVLMRTGNYIEAEEQLRKVRAVSPQYQPATMLLAEVLLENPQKERLAEAKRLLADAREASPDNPDVEELWGRVLLAGGSSSLAIRSLLKVVAQRQPGEKRDQSLLFLSGAFNRYGDLERAISALREAANGGSEDVAVYDELAARLDEQGDIGGSLSAAEKAVELTRENRAQNGKRLRRLAEYLERSGQLAEAAYKYGEASRVTEDGKISSLLKTHSNVLLLRAGRANEAGIVAKAGMTSDRNASRFSPLIVPGGLEALERMTGVSSDEPDPVVLARVFDACLRNSSLAYRLVNFYAEYPDLTKKVSLSLNGFLDLPSPAQTGSAQAREALKFFGVVDKGGRREVKGNELQARQPILEALGGDAGKLQRGEPVKIKLQNGELPVLRGMDAWTTTLKETRPELQLLAFLKNPQAMRLYVAYSMLTDEAIREFGPTAFGKEKPESLAGSLYFATPYLRFTPQGDLEIPGQRPGEMNWRGALRLNQAVPLSRALFEKDNGGALYLFCALSAAGEVGDAISRSPAFDQVFRMVDKSLLPSTREPFDLIDFFRLLRIENDQLRLPKVGEVWMGSSGDPVFTLLMRMGRVTPGRPIPLVKQLAVLTQIERERKDLAASSEAVALIARQTAENREAELEVALDLGMSESQLNLFFSQIAKLDALPASPGKVAAIRSFQSAFELLRVAAINSSVTQPRITDLTDRLLKLDPTAPEYAWQLVAFFKTDLLGSEPATTSVQIDNKIVELLLAGPPLSLPARKRTEKSESKLQLDAALKRQEESRRFLSSQKYTPFIAVVDAFSALEELRKNPASSEDLNKLRNAANAFVEPEREPEPKKKKPKHPVVQEPLLREVVGGLALPVSPSTINDVRSRVASFVGEGLLAYVYAAHVASSSEGSFSPDLVRKHDFANSPWGNAQLDNTGRVSGSAARLAQVLAQLEAKSALYASNSSLAEAMLASAKLQGRRWITRRAEEYVARSMDLGEDVLARSAQSDEIAMRAVLMFDHLMSSRRAKEIRSLIDRNEIGKALQVLAPSELYFLGQNYFRERMVKSTPAELAMEPGSLGALARIVVAEQSNADAITGSLEREIRQFGMPTTLRTGLARLDLIEPESYEQCLTFQDEDRMAQRVQDVKLATIRKLHRLGGAATLPVDKLLTNAVLELTLAQMRKAASGAPPPGRDWQSVVKATGSTDDPDLSSLMDQISKSSYARVPSEKKWNDILTSGSAETQKP